MGRADLHLHTRESDGFATVEDLVDFVEHETELDLIAVTDHEDAMGGHRAREYAARRGYRLDVVVGAEVAALQGHLLALFVEECPRSFRSIERSLEDIHRQDGLGAIVAPPDELADAFNQPPHARPPPAAGRDGDHLDAIETANPSPAGKATREHALALNQAWGLPETGGCPTPTTSSTSPPAGPRSPAPAPMPSAPPSPPARRAPACRAIPGCGKSGCAALRSGWRGGMLDFPRKMLRAAQHPRRLF